MPKSTKQWWTQNVAGNRTPIFFSGFFRHVFLSQSSSPGDNVQYISWKFFTWNLGSSHTLTWHEITWIPPKKNIGMIFQVMKSPHLTTNSPCNKESNDRPFQWHLWLRSLRTHRALWRDLWGEPKLSAPGCWGQGFDKLIWRLYRGLYLGITQLHRDYNKPWN